MRIESALQAFRAADLEEREHRGEDVVKVLTSKSKVSRLKKPQLTRGLTLAASDRLAQHTGLLPVDSTSC